VSTVDAAPGAKSSGRTAAAVILAIIAVLFIIAGLIYIIEPAKSLPSFMGHVANSNGHHPLRAAGCLIVGVVFAVGAWFAKSYRPKPQASAEASRQNSPAGRS
jgi:amino acid permease